MLPIAAPMIVPAAPSVESSTAEDTAASAPAIVRTQSMSKRVSVSVESSVIAVQYAEAETTPPRPPAYLPVA